MNGENSHKSLFLEIDVTKQLTKSGKINIEKFTFTLEHPIIEGGGDFWKLFQKLIISRGWGVGIRRG